MNETRKRQASELPPQDASFKKSALGIETFEVQPEIENFQREALWRAMQDYKRRASTAQEQLDHLIQKVAYHDDHLRIVDLWWDQVCEGLARACLTEQLLFEIKDLLPIEGLQDEFPRFAHFLDNLPEFTLHLNEKRSHILRCLAGMKRSPNGFVVQSPTTKAESSTLAARLKLAEMEVAKYHTKKDEYESKLADLESRLLFTERTIDRTKSLTLARIDLQARRLPSTFPGHVEKVEEIIPEINEVRTMAQDVNAARQQDGIDDDAKTDLADLRDLLERRTKELNTLQEKSTLLATELEHMRAKLANPDIETVERTEVHRLMKLKNQQLREQVVHMEAQNAQLSQTNSGLRSERSKFQNDLVEEHESAYNEIAALLSKAEQDLARVRAARDELHSNLQVRKAQDDHRAVAAREIGELADTQAARIAVLESELSRYRNECLEDPSSTDIVPRVEEAFVDIQVLQKQNEVLKTELSSMETAFNRAYEQNTRKVMDLVGMEDKFSRLIAEKAKADQKYFAAMKAKDQAVIEIKALRSQNNKSGEILSKLQEAEKSTKQKLDSLEKQLALSESAKGTYEKDYHLGKQKIGSLKLRYESSVARMQELQQNCAEKETILTAEANTHRQVVDELDSAKTQLKRARKLEASNGDSDQLQVYRAMAKCSVCLIHWKDTALTSCGHVFCKDCITKRIETRQRRCPSCNQSFGTGDLLQVHI